MTTTIHWQLQRAWDRAIKVPQAFASACQGVERMFQTVFFLIAFFTAIKCDPLSLCSSKTEFNFDSITFSPSAVMVGRDLRVKASGLLNVAVSPGASFKLVLKFGPIKVFENSGYTCKPGSVEDCYTPGHYDDLEAVFPIPDNVPLRQFHVQVDFMNADGSPITCIQGDIKFTSPAVMSQPEDFDPLDDVFDTYELDE